MSPTNHIAEFDGMVASLVADSVGAANKRFNAIVAERTASKSSLSGATIRKLADSGGEEIAALTDEVVKLAEQFSMQLHVNTDEMLEVVRRAVKQLPLKLVELPVIKNLESRMNKPSVRLEMLKLMQESKNRSDIKLAKLRLGIRDQGTAGNQTVNNTLTVHDVQATNFQIGVRNNAEGVSQVNDYSQLKIMIEEIESTISSGEFEAVDVSELASDIATIKSQLQKSKPSKAIISEAVKSIRSVLEGAAGGAMATYAPAWIAALGPY